MFPTFSLSVSAIWFFTWLVHSIKKQQTRLDLLFSAVVFSSFFFLTFLSFVFTIHCLRRVIMMVWLWLVRSVGRSVGRVGLIGSIYMHEIFFSAHQRYFMRWTVSERKTIFTEMCHLPHSLYLTRVSWHDQTFTLKPLCIRSRSDSMWIGVYGKGSRKQKTQNRLRKVKVNYMEERNE